MSLSTHATGMACMHTAQGRPPTQEPTHLSTPRTVRKRGMVWLGAALLAAVLQADL